MGNLRLRLFLDVAVSDFSREASLLKGFFYLFGEHDGTVFAASAAEGNRQVTLAFANVVRDEVGEKALDAAEKFSRLREGPNVFLDFGIYSGEAAQSGDEVWIGKEAHVENEVGVRGDTVLVAETDNGNEHGTLVGILEALRDELAKLVDVELGGVDNHIGEFADRLHEGAFVAQAFADGKSFAEGMGAAGLAVAAE